MTLSVQNRYISRTQEDDLMKEDDEETKGSFAAVEKRGRFRSKSWIANEHVLACNPSYLMGFLDVQGMTRMEQVCLHFFFSRLLHLQTCFYPTDVSSVQSSEQTDVVL